MNSLIASYLPNDLLAYFRWSIIPQVSKIINCFHWVTGCVTFPTTTIATSPQNIWSLQTLIRAHPHMHAHKQKDWESPTIYEEIRRLIVMLLTHTPPHMCPCTQRTRNPREIYEENSRLVINLLTWSNLPGHFFIYRSSHFLINKHSTTPACLF